ncbi:putative vacuolar protein sorting-associated protein Ist1 [Helianthus annuus]|nr:putative vacuolar protein sorting-associated protein Ist1 [Helianthus annuus]
MGRKLDALLGRKFKTSKLEATLNLAISRLSLLKNHRSARFTIALSDLVQLLRLNHHQQALLRVFSFSLSFARYIHIHIYTHALLTKWTKATET